MIARGPTLPSTSQPPRRRYHFHTPGLLYIAVTLLVAVGAFNSQNNLLFASLGLAMGGLLVSGILSGAALLGLRLERGGMSHGHVGGQLRIRYQARNSNRLMPAFGLTLEETKGDGRGKRVEESDEESLESGGPTWGRLTGPIKAFVACVPPRGRHRGGFAEAEVVVEPVRRGLLRLGPVRMWTTFPFGLAKKSVTFNLPAVSVIHPVALPVRSGVLERLTVKAVSGVGSAMAPGFGDELYGLREYADGDNPRWISWRRSARTGQLVVRQNTTPTPRIVWIVLNVEPGGDVVEAETAVALASALVRACVKEGATVGLVVPSHGVVMPPRSSPRAVGAMLERLAVIDIDAGRSGAPFPAGAVKGAANAVVSVGAQSAYGTSQTRHIDVRAAGDLLSPGPALDRAMELLRSTKRTEQEAS